ncbi:MAG: hypothetical protein R3C01_05770 [Planctomycetaceae bacterium]
MSHNANRHRLVSGVLFITGLFLFWWSWKTVLETGTWNLLAAMMSAALPVLGIGGIFFPSDLEQIAFEKGVEVEELTILDWPLAWKVIAAISAIAIVLNMLFMSGAVPLPFDV